MSFFRSAIKGFYNRLPGSGPYFRRDRIYGDKIIRMLEHLKQERTVLKLNLLGKDYERLTIVTGIIEENKSTFFLIDYPRGFKEVVGDTDPEDVHEQRMAFEFIGGDKIPFAFRTVLDRVQGREIRIKKPKFIERIQRRKHFRIEPPMDTIMLFMRDTKKCVNSVLNLSLDGALISPIAKPDLGSRLYPGEDIRHIRLMTHKKFFEIRIRIKKATIRRAGKNSETGRHFYALRFMEIEKEDKNNLEKWLYKWQRAILQKRSLLTEDKNTTED